MKVQRAGEQSWAGCEKRRRGAWEERTTGEQEGDGEEGEQEDKEKGKEAGVTISDQSYDAKYLLTNTQPSPECWRER